MGSRETAGQQARGRGIEALSLLVQVPAYAQLERDYRGLVEVERRGPWAYYRIRKDALKRLAAELLDLL